MTLTGAGPALDAKTDGARLVGARHGKKKHVAKLLTPVSWLESLLKRQVLLFRWLRFLFRVAQHIVRNDIISGHMTFIQMVWIRGSQSFRSSLR